MGQDSSRVGATAPSPVAPAGHAASPRTETVIAEIWREVLDVPEVRALDNFFDLGGHSVLLAVVSEQITHRLGKSVALLDLFSHPTVRALARHVDQLPGERAHDHLG
jgi:mycobactin peptide synthetase MbtE